MKQDIELLTVTTMGPGLYEFTHALNHVCAQSGIRTGLMTVYCTHTSASLLIQENADPAVQEDLEAIFRRLVPEGDPLFVHTAEGPDDMPAHVKAALTQTTLSIPIMAGRLVLGRWQGAYVFEHRSAPHERTLVVHVIGQRD